MDQRKLPCVCGLEFDEEQFKEHFGKCRAFKEQFKEFDQKFGELLKSYSEPKERLIIVKFLLKQYINVIDKRLIRYFGQNPKVRNFPNQGPVGDVQAPGPSLNPPIDRPRNDISHNNQFQNNLPYNPYKEQPNPYPQIDMKNKISNPYAPPPENPDKKINQISYNPYSQQSQNMENVQHRKQSEQNYIADFDPQPIKKEEQDLTSCQICKNKPDDITYLSCLHPICMKCFRNNAEKNFYGMKCKICEKEIDENDKTQILGPEKYEELVSKALGNMFGSLVQCPNPKCQQKIAFEPGQIDYKVRDDQNNILTRQAAEDYAKNRCRCGFCQNNFCVSCGAVPYHIGKTCQEFKHHQVAVNCRYCDEEIKGHNRGPDSDVCNKQECTDRFRWACKKRLPCGHKCFGVNGEKECPPCLNSDCKGYVNKFDQDKDAYCTICYTEGLGAAPIVALSCGHYAHYHCVKKRLETRWIGPKITFNHCLCPGCNNWYECKSVPDLQNLIMENKKLYDVIVEMALKRLKFEDLDKDPRLSDKNSPWYGKKIEFAMKRLTYYMCYVCKQPYFAGRRECGNDPNLQNDDPNKNYDPKDCVCGKDANLSGIAGVSNCQKHGKDFIEYKCKFCCKIASWFCWGTTHFCEDCHRRQCNNDYVSKYPRDKLPKCDPRTCEVGGDHPPNGEEFALGCSLCRNNAANQKDF